MYVGERGREISGTGASFRYYLGGGEGVHQLMLSGSDPVGWAGLRLYQKGGGSPYLPKCIVENGGGRKT